MNPNHNPIEETDFNATEFDLNDSGSLDDFIKQLEEKEKDLRISSELVVEVDAYQNDDSFEDDIEKLINSYQSKPIEMKAAPSDYQAPASSNVGNADLEAELRNLRDQVAKTSAEKTEIQETFRRRQTDFENFRRRADRERSEVFGNVVNNLAIKILPVVDNLERALASANSLSREKSQDFQNFIDGVNLVNHQLQEVLGEMGVEPIICLGRPFDPNFHEAVATAVSSNAPPNTVIEELLRGYRIDQKVVRASMVKVSVAARAES